MTLIIRFHDVSRRRPAARVVSCSAPPFIDEEVDMGSIRHIFTLAACLLATACGDATAPGSSPDPKAASLELRRMTGIPATTDAQELAVQVDFTIPIACAGEDVRFVGTVVYRIHETIAPAGNRLLHVTVPASATSDPLLAIGQSTDRVWTLERGTSSQTIVWTGEDTRIVNVTRSESFVTADGEILRLMRVAHLIIEDGVLTGVERESWSCRP